MPDYRSQFRDGYQDGRGGREHSQDDDPPMSRLFIICSKSHTEEEFREAFKEFGNIEDIWVVKDKHTQENKGIAYIKFSKTSDAAKAQEEMNGKPIGKIDRALKVLVAANRSEGSSKSENEQERYLRLFIVIPKQATEDEIKSEFSQFGDVESVTIVKDRGTGNPKGFAYVRFSRFYHAALAFENCSPKFKAVFAEPKGSTRIQKDQERRSFEDHSFSRSAGSGLNNFNNFYNDWGNTSLNNDMTSFLRMQNVAVPQSTSLEVIASSSVTQNQLWRLFDIIPGLDYCQITRELGPRTNEVIAMYHSPEAAIYARNKLHDLEYPSGEPLIVKLSEMNSSMDNSFTDRRKVKDSICNVSLPPAQPLAPLDAPVQKRLFIVLSANVPQPVLKDVFSCWKDLIDVYLLPNKNCGYVKYADRESAQRAIHALHGAEICGAKIKVMEAEERRGLDGDEFPMGAGPVGKIGGMNSSGGDSSLLVDKCGKEFICNVPLPPAEPFAPFDALVEQRLFIVLSDNLPQSILKDVFSRWKGFIDVYLLPNKNCGYVKYADGESAQKAIQVLHGAEICGTKIKVMEAEERRGNDADDIDRKRMRRS